MYPELTEVMVFAAGFGTRMEKLTISTPKPLIKVGSKPLFEPGLNPAWRLAPQCFYSPA